MDHYEYGELLKTLDTKMQNISNIVRPTEIKKRLDEIEAMENDQDFWNDAANAATIQKEKTQLERKLDKFNKASSTLSDAEDLYDMAKEEKDDETIDTLFSEADSLEENVNQMEVEVMLSGEHDANSAILSNPPGAGVTF